MLAGKNKNCQLRVSVDRIQFSIEVVFFSVSRKP